MVNEHEIPNLPTMWYERYQPRKKTLTCKYVTHNELISYNREKFRVCTKVKLVPTSPPRKK
jgi:hypothetical protein